MSEQRSELETILYDINTYARWNSETTLKKVKYLEKIDIFQFNFFITIILANKMIQIKDSI